MIQQIQSPAASRSRRILSLVACAAALSLVGAGCRPKGAGPGADGAAKPVERMNRGIALLEQYQYLDAFKIFEDLAKEYPAWEAAHVNQGIAAFNLQDEYLKIAEERFKRALAVNPQSPHAMLSLAILYNYTQRLDEALHLVKKVVEIDPDDPHALFYMGVFLSDSGDPDGAVAALERVVRLQPSFASAHYRLMAFYRKSGDRAKHQGAAKAFSGLSEAKVGVLVGNKYGENGKYNSAIRDSTPPGWKGDPASWTPPASPSLGPAVPIGRPHVAFRRPDGRINPPAFAVGDLDGDGSCEIVLCGEAPEASSGRTGSESSSPQISGPEASSWVSIYAMAEGGGTRCLDRFPIPAIVCALGNLDAHEDVGDATDDDADLVLAGDGFLEILFNDGTGKLAARGEGEGAGVGIVIEKARHDGFPVRLYVADLDSDWDLDIACLRQERGADGKVASRLEILNNNRDGTFRDISGEIGIEPFGFPAAELLVTDLDGDVDADILVIDGASGRPYFFQNERLWRYRLREENVDALRAPGVVSAVGGDFDGDGDPDIILLAGDALHLWRNEGGLRFVADGKFKDRWAAVGGTAAVLFDFRGALRLDLLVLDPRGPKGAALGTGLLIAGPDAPTATALEIGASAPVSALATIRGRDGPPEIIVYDAADGARAVPITSFGRNWLALSLEGSKNPVPDKERSNLSAIGATVEIRAGERRIVLAADSGSGGTARAPARVYAGLGGRPVADYARILWPDAVLQSELSLEGGKLHDIQQIERKPTSCPMLFAWDGSRFRLVGDFLGVGGLGYFETPGVYSRPDPTEYVLLDRLAPLDGAYALEIIEPMEECTYLDRLSLTVVEHPRDVEVLPEEMFAIGGPPPGYHLLAFREKLFPVRAEADGRDITAELREIDRVYGNSVDRDRRFAGLARSAHRIDLVFDDGLDHLLAGVGEAASSAASPPTTPPALPAAPLAASPAASPGSRPYLILYGYVEYAYSTSNFAAWQANATFRAPTVLVEREGQWVVLRDQWGFPGGTPRYLAFDLRGALRPGDRRLRVETNMDIHWDQAFLIDSDAEGELRVVDLEPDSAILSYKGFPAEVSPDGRLPRIFQWRDFEPTAPVKVFPGSYTRYGEVRELLYEADDRFVIFGPGDGLSVRFRADRVAPPEPGKARTFLAKTFGYCKDTDLYTAHPERVEPLPFRAMGGYPFPESESAGSSGKVPAYPTTPLHERYLREWNVRRVEGTPLDPIGPPRGSLGSGRGEGSGAGREGAGAGARESGTPESGTPETGTPETGTSETGTSETGTP